MNMKCTWIFTSLLFLSGYAMSNPCQDFIDFTKVKDHMFSNDGPSLCIVDKRLAQDMKYVEKRTLQTDNHGDLILMISETGTVAIVADVLSISGRAQNIAGVERVVAELVRDVIDCVRDPGCREMVREVVRDIAVERFVDGMIDRVVENVRELLN